MWCDLGGLVLGSVVVGVQWGWQLVGGGSSVGSLVGGSDATISDSKFSCLVCGLRSLGKNWNMVSISSGVCRGDGQDGPGSPQWTAVKWLYSS